MLEMKRRLGLLALSLCAAVFVSGCHDDDETEEGVGTQIDVSAAKGAIVGAVCSITNFPETTTYGVGTTAAPDGKIRFGLTFFGGIPEDSVALASCRNPAVGGPAEYFNEAANAFVPLPAGRVIRAVIPSTELVRPAPSVAVTALTDLAATALMEAADECGCEPTAGGARLANQEIAGLFGLENLLSPPTVINDGSPTLQDNEAGQYALILAALTTVVGGGDPFAYVDQIAAAISSGNTAFLEDMQEELAAAVQTYVNSVDASGIPQSLVSRTIAELLAGDTTVVIDPDHGGG